MIHSTVILFQRVGCRGRSNVFAVCSGRDAARSSALEKRRRSLCRGYSQKDNLVGTVVRDFASRIRPVRLRCSFVEVAHTLYGAASNSDTRFRYGDEAPYHTLHELLRHVANEINIDFNSPFDWEEHFIQVLMQDAASTNETRETRKA